MVRNPVAPPSRRTFQGPAHSENDPESPRFPWDKSPRFGLRACGWATDVDRSFLNREVSSGFRFNVYAIAGVPFTGQMVLAGPDCRIGHRCDQLQTQSPWCS
jgi:hypothetical protein